MQHHYCLSGWLPLTQSVRHGSKAVTRHRKPLHILRQKLLAVTEYIPAPRPFPPGAYPSETKRVQEEVRNIHSLHSFHSCIFYQCESVLTLCLV